IAGIGRLIASIQPQDEGKPMPLTAPTRRFFSVQRAGNRRQAQGTLMNALQKSGVTPVIATARARNIWVKPFLQQQNLEGCLLAHPYHEDPAAENGRAYTGKRTLISPDAKT